MSDIQIRTEYTSNVQQGAMMDAQALEMLSQIANRTNTMCVLLANGFSGVTTMMEQMQGSVSANVSAMSQMASAQDKVSTSSKSVTSGMNQTARSISNATSSAHASKGGFANLWSSLMRIAKLRFLRGIIRSVTQGFREGIGNIYAYSQALGGLDSSNASGTLNSIASSFLYLKNSIGASVAPVLQAIAPILATIVNWAVAALNAIGKLFALLSGKSTYTQAKKVQTSWGGVTDSTKGATKAAKEYKNTILGFDELNPLNDVNDSGGGGGGGGASAPDVSDMFEEVPIEAEGLLNLINQLWKAIKPIVKKIASFMGQQIGDGISAIGAAFLALDGILNKQPDKIKKAFDKMQNILQNNAFVNGIYKFTLKVEKWFTTLGINIARSVVGRVKKIFENLRKIAAALFGEDLANKWFNGIIDGLDKTEKKLDDDKKAAEDFYDAMMDWADGKETIDVIIDENGKLQYQLKQTKEGIEKTGGSLGKWDSKGIEKVADSMDTINASAKEVQESTKDAKGAVRDFGNMKPDFTGVNDSFDKTAKKAGTLNTIIGKIHKGLKTINEMKVQPVIKATMSIQQAAQTVNKEIKPYVQAEGGFVPRFDMGGINTADIFVANENSKPELVGRIGNRTAVANTGQMVDAMAAGVAQAFQAYGGGSENVEFNVYMDSTRLAQAVQRGQKNINRRYAVAVR